MRGIQQFCTPTAETFEGVRVSGDGRVNPNKLSWQVHDYIEQYRLFIEGEALSPVFTGWIMGFPLGFADTNFIFSYKLV